MTTRQRVSPGAWALFLGGVVMGCPATGTDTSETGSSGGVTGSSGGVWRASSQGSSAAGATSLDATSTAATSADPSSGDASSGTDATSTSADSSSGDASSSTSADPSSGDASSGADATSTSADPSSGDASSSTDATSTSADSSSGDASSGTAATSADASSAPPSSGVVVTSGPGSGPATSTTLTSSSLPPSTSAGGSSSSTGGATSWVSSAGAPGSSSGTATSLPSSSSGPSSSASSSSSLAGTSSSAGSSSSYSFLNGTKLGGPCDPFHQGNLVCDAIYAGASCVQVVGETFGLCGVRSCVADGCAGIGTVCRGTAPNTVCVTGCSATGGDGQCGTGAACVSFVSGPSCYPLLAAACRYNQVPTGCADGYTCSPVGTDGYGQCDQTCDLFAQDCSTAGQACYPQLSGPAVCTAQGAVPVGQVCTATDDCVAGSTCVTENGQGVCRTLCDNAHVCATGACVPLIGFTNLGVCTGSGTGGTATVLGGPCTPDLVGDARCATLHALAECMEVTGEADGFCAIPGCVAHNCGGMGTYCMGVPPTTVCLQGCNVLGGDGQCGPDAACVLFAGGLATCYPLSYAACRTTLSPTGCDAGFTCEDVGTDGFGSCVQLCDVFLQDCLVPADACYPRTGGAPVCATAGSVPNGQPCTYLTECVEGSLCVGSGPVGTCGKLCNLAHPCSVGTCYALTGQVNLGVCM